MPNDNDIDRLVTNATDDLLGGKELATVSRVRVEAIMRRLARQVQTEATDHARARLLTVEEVAERYGVAGATVRKWCQEGKLLAERFGVGNRATWLIAEESLETFVPPREGRPRK